MPQLRTKIPPSTRKTSKRENPLADASPLGLPAACCCFSVEVAEAVDAGGEDSEGLEDAVCRYRAGVAIVDGYRVSPRCTSPSARIDGRG